MKTNTCKIFHVDFKNRTLKTSEEKTFKIKSKFDFSNFQEIPKESKYYGIKDQERYSISENILKNIDRYNFAELVEFANNGILDFVKVDEELGLGLEKEFDSPSPA